MVANKFQTGFDQPLLHTMYVDTKLGGVNAVQTLSRLNRTHPDKRGTMVLDFANDAEAIQKAFEPYYEATLLSEATDPNLLYDVQQRLLEFDVFTEAEVRDFAALYFDPGTTQDQVYAALAPYEKRFGQLAEDEQLEFRGQLTDYVRLYAFLSQVLTFADAELEMLYAFARHLRRRIKADRATLPLEVQQSIDMESYRVQQTASGTIGLERGQVKLDPTRSKDPRGATPEDLEPLSVIIAALNERFGLELGPGDRLTVGQVMGELDADAALETSAAANTRENVRLTFDRKVDDAFQDIVDSNFDLYKRVTDDDAFGKAIKEMLFDRYMRGRRRAEELLEHHESKTLEFKSTLRWNVKEKRKDPKIVTHSVLKTLAAFLNTEGGDLLIGVADDQTVPGIAADGFESDDRFLLHLSHVVAQGLGDRAGTCIDPRIQLVHGRPVCLVGCQRSPEPVFLKWKKLEKSPEGDFFVRIGAQTKKLAPDSAAEYIRTRFS